MLNSSESLYKPKCVLCYKRDNMLMCLCESRPLFVSCTLMLWYITRVLKLNSNFVECGQGS